MNRQIKQSMEFLIVLFCNIKKSFKLVSMNHDFSLLEKVTAAL